MVQRSIGRFLVAAAVAAGALVPAAAPAYAGSDCPWYAVCGDVYNRSGGHQIRIAGCWNDSYGTRYYADELPCNPEMELANGRDSDDYSGFEDTDAFRAYRGCVTKVVGTAPQGMTTTYDRRGLSSMWVKITDLQDVTVKSITC